jgi:cation:H+ antiporter
LSPTTPGLLVLGLVLLVAGAELLVRGASRLAAAFGITPLVIGLTVVAFGTSAPELAVSLQSAWGGSADIALGNVLGSNVFNVLVILGLSAAVSPLVVHLAVIRFDVPLMIAVSVAAWLMALDGRIGRADGALLFAGVIAYSVWSIRAGRAQSPDLPAQALPERSRRSLLTSLLLVALGLVLLVLGARWLVQAATDIARALGLSELVIGLTIVAGGTSLPELATSVVAAARGQRDIAVGNVVGSNLFNLLSVLGGAALLSPAGISVPAQALAFDLPIMTAVAFACLPVFLSGHAIARWEGLLFLGYYAAYTAWLVLAAQASAALPWFRAAMLFLVVPLTVLTLAIATVRWLSPARRRGAG